LLLQRFLRATRDDGQRPVIALGERAVITTPLAARLLERSAQNGLRQMVPPALATRQRAVVSVPLSTGDIAHATSTPLFDGDRLVGVLIELGPPGGTEPSRPTDPPRPTIVGTSVAAGADNGLTRREHEVLTLIVAGCANKTIARRLSIHEDTVKTHVTRIFGKLGVRSRTQAALTAVRQGVVST
jgi:DNA-binding CsgD family transcriptional regulator